MHASVASLLAVAGAAQATCTFHWKASEGNTCNSMANDWNVPVQTFIRWNEGAVGSDCARGISPGSIYCVEWANEAAASASAPAASMATSIRDSQYAPPSVTSQPAPVQDGIAADCDKWYRAQRGDTCQGIVDRFGGGLTVPDFEAWNPAVKPDCSALLATYYYCIARKPAPTKPTQPQAIATPQPYFSDMTRSCNKFYRAAKGDTCDSISDKFQGLSVPDFQNWNPSVRADCTGIIATYYYCVGSYTSRDPIAPSGTSSVFSLASAASSLTPSSVSSSSPSPLVQSSSVLSSASTPSPATPAGTTPARSTLAKTTKNQTPSPSATPPSSALASAAAAKGAVPVPTQSGLTRQCKEYYKVKEGDFCYKLTKQYNHRFTVDQL